MRKFLKFLGSGFFTYGLSLGLTYLFVDFFLLSHFFAYFCVLLLITLINFFLATTYIFQGKKSRDVIARYTAALLFFTFVNYAGTSLCTYFFGEKYFYLIIFLMTTFVFLGKFFTYDRFVFKK